MARIKKIPLRLVVSVMAVLMLAVAVPLSVAVADGMNGMIGGGSKTVFDLSSGDDFEQMIPAIGGTINLAYKGDVLLAHRASNDVKKYDSQLVFYSSTIGQDLNQMVVSYADPSNSAVRDNSMRINVDYSVKDWIDDGVESLVLSLAYSRDVALKVTNGAYEEGVNPGNAINFVGLSGTDVKIIRIPFSISSENSTHGYAVGSAYILNLTAEPRDYRITVNQIDVLKAATSLSQCQETSMIISLVNKDSTDSGSIINGDIISFGAEIQAQPVNGFAIADGVVGILGVCLIVGAVFATPWVQRGTPRNAWNRVFGGRGLKKLSRRGRR